MNNENKDFFTNDVESNISEEEIILAPPAELFDEAKEIAQNTVADEKYPFGLQYDANQKAFLLSMLQDVGAIVEYDDEEGRTLSTMMNMAQLAFVKQLDCVERVRTDEGMNPFILEVSLNTESNQSDRQSGEQFVEQIAMAMYADTDDIVLAETEVVNGDTVKIDRVNNQSTDNHAAVMSVPASVSSCDESCCGSCNDCCTSHCGCQTNTSMESAKEIRVESYISGHICCPGTEQWFKFTAPQNEKYTVYTSGTLDTIGTLYDCCGCQIARNDDAAGKLNFRIVKELSAGQTYYVKVQLYNNAVGNYTIRVTHRIFANEVTVSPVSITLEKGVLYELPITPNYIYKGYNGAKRIPGLSVTVKPSDAHEQKVWWWEQYGDVLDCSYGWDNDGDRYIHVKAVNYGTSKLYAEDWNENGRRDECTVYVGGKPVTGIKLDFSNKTMHVGDENYLYETITPSNAYNKNVNWSSSNSTVAEVNSAGKVKAKSIGTTVITARTEDGGYTAECNIVVVDGVIIEKTDADHNRILFPNGKVWNCINFDIINNYNLNQNDFESQRFYDNTYANKTYDEIMGYDYSEPFKEYSDDELKIIYMIDPYGMAAYVREYASALPDSEDGFQTTLSKIIAYKDSTFRMLFGRSPRYYKRNMLGTWYQTTNTSDWTDVVSESECLFGGHSIYDGKFWLEFVTVLFDLVTMLLPSLGFSERIVKKILKAFTYYSLLRSVSQSVLDEDFNGFLSAIANGLVDEDDLDETIIINGEPYKAANYTLSWAFSLLSLSSDMGVLADTFGAGPHFYKEVFTQCTNDTEYNVYLRVADGNLVSISNLATILD